LLPGIGIKRMMAGFDDIADILFVTTGLLSDYAAGCRVNNVDSFTPRQMRVAIKYREWINGWLTGG